MVVNVPEIFKEHPYDEKKLQENDNVSFFQTRFHRFYRNRFIPARYRKSIWKVCRNTHIDLSWYETFKYYWRTVLKGRGVWSVQDFFFLRGIYSVASANQSLNHEHGNEIVVSENEHLRSWQNPNVIQKLFHMVNREYFSHQFLPLELMQKYHDSPKNILEYGCATAPITLSYFEFFNPVPQQRFYIADLEYLPFHYGCFRFRHFENVVPILLKPEDNFQLNDAVKFDVIFCRNVFEHLNQPLDTARKFFNLLNPGGLLIFDYVMTDLSATSSTNLGLDHYQGHAQRSNVLDFFESNFELLEGALHRDKGLGLCVLKKA